MPTEVLADESTQRDTRHKGYGHAAEHRGDGTGRFLTRHQAGGDYRTDAEEYAMR